MPILAFHLPWPSIPLFCDPATLLCGLQVMHHVVDHPEEVAAKGQAARRLMVQRYSPEAVGAIVARHLERIKHGLRVGSLGPSLGRTRNWGA